MTQNTYSFCTDNVLCLFSQTVSQFYGMDTVLLQILRKSWNIRLKSKLFSQSIINTYIFLRWAVEKLVYWPLSHIWLLLNLLFHLGLIGNLVAKLFLSYVLASTESERSIWVLTILLHYIHKFLVMVQSHTNVRVVVFLFFDSFPL